MENDEEYHDGQFEYTTASSLIEEIIDRFNFRAYIYLEGDGFDNIFSEVQVHDDEDDEVIEEVQYAALRNLVGDIIQNLEDDDRNEAIAMIYDIVHEAIHLDDGPEPEDDDFEEESD